MYNTYQGIEGRHITKIKKTYDLTAAVGLLLPLVYIGRAIGGSCFITICASVSNIYANTVLIVDQKCIYIYILYE